MPVRLFSADGLGSARHMEVVLASSLTGSCAADLYPTTTLAAPRALDSNRIRQYIEFAPRKARLVPASRALVTVRRIPTDQYSSCPMETIPRAPSNTCGLESSSTLVR